MLHVGDINSNTKRAKIQPFLESSCPSGRKQLSLRRPRKRIQPRRMSGKFTVEETSPVAAPAASEKKLALPLPHTSSTDIAVTPLATDGASSSSNEMKGQSTSQLWI